MRLFHHCSNWSYDDEHYTCTFASQQTFGVAGHPLMMLASFMLCAGFCLSAFHMAQDASLRRLTKTSAGSKVFGEMGSSQFGQDIEKKVLNVLDKEEEVQLAKEHTNIQPSSEQEDVKSYLDNVLDEIEQNKWKDLGNIPTLPRFQRYLVNL